MKSTEFRIGNLVQYGANVHTVMTLDNCVRVSGCDDWIFADNKDLTGIPLTEDWLVRFNCKHEGNKFYRLGETNLVVQFKDNGLITVYLQVDPTIHSLAVIDYVHQLQNLFLCLCGEELTLKDK